MSRSLPPLPRKYRRAGTTGSMREEYGFRWGAFVLSLAFFLIGALTLLTSPFLDDGVLTAVAGGLVVVAVVSGWASHGWSDRPLQGLRRLLADLPFIVLGCVAIAAVAYLGYGVAVVAIRLVSEDPRVLLFGVPVLVLLLVIQRKTGVVDLMRVSLQPWTTFTHTGTVAPNPQAGEEHPLSYIEVLRRLRFWGP